MSTFRENKVWSKTAPDGRWDYIVVGSGMGGMTTAAILAKLGKKVLVLEQHYVAGGFTHTFKRKQWHWDVGVHAIGEVTNHSMLGRILSDLTNGELEWTSLGPVYEQFYYPDGFRIDFPDNPRQYKENLYAAFPNDREAIDEYFRLVRRTVAAMRGYYMYRALPDRAADFVEPFILGDASKFTGMTLKAVLDTITTNERLKTILSGQWGYYGSPPSQASFAIHATVVHHFLHGAYYPVGGSKRIAQTMLKTVADAGGWTRIRASVERILIENGRAVGVRLEGGEEIRAERVVSAASALVTINQMLPPEERPKDWVLNIRSLPPSPAHLCLYLGFKGDIASAGASSANQWFWETWDAEASFWNTHVSAARCPVLYTSYPSLKDPTHKPGPEQIHTGEVITFAPFADFRKWVGTEWMNRGAEYDAMKADLTGRMLEQFFEYRPGLRPLMQHAELSTPLTTENFTRPPEGAIYGVVSTPARYQNPWLRPRTPIKNLFLSGCDMGAAGVMGAFVGGVLCAVAAEPVGAIRYLRKALTKRSS